MKLGYSLGIFAALLFVFPSISEARQGEPPRSCMRNGYFDCSIHGCQRYCIGGNNRHNGQRVNPAPPPVVRPAPATARRTRRRDASDSTGTRARRRDASDSSSTGSRTGACARRRDASDSTGARAYRRRRASSFEAGNQSRDQKIRTRK